MAIVPAVKLGPFLGENNRLERYALQTEEGAFLADSSNIDIDNTGRINCANGKTKVSSLTTGRGMFSDGERTLFADGNSLRKVVSFSPFSSEVVDSVASGRIAYAERNGEIYYTDGAKISRLDADNLPHVVGIPVPLSLSGSVVAGGLQKGWYQATITYFVGVEEGGAYPSINIDLPTQGGIRLSLPTPPSGITAIGVYLSDPNSETPMFHGVVSPSTSTIDLIVVPSGRQCMTQFMAPMPAGEHIGFCLDRMLTASGAVLSYSERYNFAMTNPAQNYIIFPKSITVMQPCKDGVYVVAEKTYWITNFNDLLGDPVLPYGAVAYSSGLVPNENKAFWLSERGLVVGDAMGQVVNMQEKALLLSLNGSGAGVFVEGNNRYVVTNG